jgi:hypothetical protein
MSGFRSSRNTVKFEKFEIEEAVPTMGDAFDGACTLLEEKGLSNDNSSAPVTIVINNFHQGENGQRIPGCLVYIGATPEEVTNDLLLMQKD